MYCSFYQVFFAINAFMLVINSAVRRCRYLCRDSTINSVGLQMDILSVVFRSALCRVDAFVVLSLTVTWMWHYIAVCATAFIVVSVTVIWMWCHIGICATVFVPISLLFYIMWHAVKWQQSYYCTFAHIDGHSPPSWVGYLRGILFLSTWQTQSCLLVQKCDYDCRLSLQNNYAEIMNSPMDQSLWYFAQALTLSPLTGSCICHRLCVNVRSVAPVSNKC